jgi:2OG-Fe(II) oxygenase superfamily
MSALAIKGGLCRAFSNVEGAGTFSCFNVLNGCQNPGLFIEGLGTVGLPLSVRDAQAIADLQATQQSPFGEGTETFVDTSVRKSWQIDPKHFQLRNPQFDSQLDLVIEAVAKELKVGCGPTGVDAELYKLLLYEEGAFFLPHQDGEKAEGMFGTLMICLPSKHTGGDLHLSHEGRHQVFGTAPSSEFGYSSSAWYSDVNHEVKPVTSGYRLVLIYNLIQRCPGPKTMASASTDTKRNLEKVLAEWDSLCSRENPDIPRMLAYKLSYKYFQANLSFDSLKGSDHAKFQRFREACGDQSFDLYLAHIEKEVSGGCDEDNWGRSYNDQYETSDEEEGDENLQYLSQNSDDHEVHLGGYHKIVDFVDSSIKLTRVIDVSGKKVAKDVDFEVRDIAQGNIFKRAPDGEDYSGYTGNEGVSTTHFYRDTVVLLMPRQSKLDFEYKAAKGDEVRIETWLTALMNDLENAQDESCRQQLERLCQLVLKDNKDANYGRHIFFWQTRIPNKAIVAVIAAAAHLDDILLLEDAVQQLRGEPPLTVLDSLALAIQRHGFDLVQPSVQVVFTLLENIHSKWSALRQVAGKASFEASSSSVSNTAGAEAWMQRQIGSVLCQYQTVNANDGTALADMAVWLGADVLKNRIAPYVEERARSTLFATAFLLRLFDLNEQSQITRDCISEVYSKIIRTVMGHLVLVPPKQIATQPSWHPHGYRRSYSIQAPSANTSSRLTKGDQLMQILRHCEALSLHDVLGDLVRKIQSAANSGETDTFEFVLLPYLRQLLDHLRSGRTSSLLGNECSAHVLMILRSYLTRYVRHEPAVPPGLRRPIIITNCYCNDCRDLQAFVHDDNRKSHEFCMHLNRRKHIEQKLDSSPYDYRTETIKNRSPHTLVVTKVWGEFLHLRAQWQKRFDTAKMHISALDKDPWLKRMLGDSYDGIVNLKMREQPSRVTIPNWPNHNHNQPSTAVTGSKRKGPVCNGDDAAKENKRPKMEVVDLTSD